jgi:hypothetical protein
MLIVERDKHARGAFWRPFLAGMCVTGVVSVAAQAIAREGSFGYRRIAAKMLAPIRAGEAAFARRDADAVGAFLADDYSFYTVNAEGPKEVIRGRDASVGMIRRFFHSGTWRTSDVERLGLVGNILVQVEMDTIEVQGKPVKKTSLEVYEFKDGQRWREWKFTPLDARNVLGAAP